MTPFETLSLVAGLTSGAYAVELIARRVARRQVRRLAKAWGMNFGRVDMLRLTDKVARHFPLPGAANLRVTNVIYGLDGDRYRYVFTAEYTAGVVHAKRRLVRVGSFAEPRDRDRGGPPGPVVLAPEELSRIEQYRHLAPAGA